MKNIFKYLASALFIGLSMTACSPEEFSGANGNVPNIADADYTVDVNQETNIVTFTLNNKGAYPIWEIEGTPDVKTTVNGYTKYYVFKGTYKYTLQIANANGVSDGKIEGEFTVNETRYDFSSTITKLTGDGTKEWRISSKDKAHMACGEPGSDGTNWWSAGADEKASEGIYDDRITFSNDNKYTYSAGEDGLTFCNQGVTTLGVTGAGGDYSTDVSGIAGVLYEGQYSLGYDDETGYETITLPAGMLFPYMANDNQMSGATTFKILKITDKKMELVYDVPGSIAWHYTFINGEDEAPSTDFDPDKVNWCAVDAPENLGAGFNTKGEMNFWWANAGWGQIGDPGFSYANGVYTITTTENGGGEWQAQCTIAGVPLQIEKEQYYDISCKVVSSAAIDRVTVKVNKDPDVDGDPNTLFYKGNYELSRGENYLRFAKVMALNNGEPISFDQGKFILDLGGAPVGVTVELSEIIIQKHNPK